MDWQQPVSLLVVAVAAILVIRHEWRSKRRASRRACGSDCGCESARNFTPKDSEWK
jgi:hypothetical protein